MSQIDRLEEATNAVAARCPLKPAIGIVLGSGLAPLARHTERATRIPLAQIPHMPVGSTEGHGNELLLGFLSGTPIAVLSGRAHLYEGFSAQEVAFPVRLLAKLGARALVLTSACGSVNVNYRPGELVVLEDHVNLMGANPLCGPQEDRLGARFPDMSEAYDPRLREIAEKACWKSGVTVRRGVYLAMAGPSYETPAEIRMARTLGADVVGMSTVPEVIVARQCGLRVLALCCITNMAAGVVRKPLTHEEVLASAAKVRAAIADVLSVIVSTVASEA